MHTLKTVGRFSLVRDGDAVRVAGPADYLASPNFGAAMDRINRGDSAIVNSGFAPDPLTAVLVAIQTDYAGWAGMRRFRAEVRS